MKLFAVAAVVGLAAAQLEMLSQVPQCALECFTGTIMKTDCALTDFYCQCGKNFEFIQKTTLECLCSSECTTSDLAKVYSISNDLCTKTLEAHGETYQAPADTLTSGICHSGETTDDSAASAAAPSTEEAVASSTSGASVAAAAATGSSNSTGTAHATNGTSSSSPKATSSTADFTGAAASGFGMSVAAIAIGGLAFMI